MVDAREYHERTNHTPRSVREDDFRLDPSNKPRPYKVYADLPRVAGEEPVAPTRPALEAVAGTTPDPPAGSTATGENGDAVPHLPTLCHYATGVTKVLQGRGETYRFRAASCTGKLYHVDLYAVCGDGGAFDAGVYHYDPDTGGFDVLREGDYRGVLAGAAGGHAGVADAPVTVVATSTWWRNAWKYRDRTYRHAFWDSGTILANLLATASATGHRAETVLGFADDPVATLLGVDPAEEAPLELVAVGADAPVPDALAVDPIDPAEEPLSPDPVDYPLVHDAWRQSALAGGEAREWRERALEATGAALGTHDPGGGERIALDPVDGPTASARPLGATVERRGSLREYAHDTVSDRKLATVLDRALWDQPLDCLGDVHDLLDFYCLVHAVEGVPDGAYQYHHARDEFERVGDADRRTSGHLALDQPVVGDAAVNVYAMADIDRVVDELGNRGYRLAQLAGGIALGRLYLAAYAHLALGGRGFTFYDELVTDHLSPRAANQAPMTLFAFGRPAT